MSGTPYNSGVGEYGERLAARRLVAIGMVLIERNWRCPLGELDLVLREGDELVCCEVKTRTSATYGHPLEAVGEAKARRLRRLAGVWAEANGVEPDRIRIDVVSVLLGRGAAEIQHLRGVA